MITKGNYSDKISKEQSKSKIKSLSKQNSPKTVKDDEEIDMDYNNLNRIISNNSKLKFKSDDHNSQKNKESCDKCLNNVDKIIHQVDSYIQSLINKTNNIYYKSSFYDSLVNVDFLHSQIYYSIDKVQLPEGVKTSLKTLFVSKFL